ncbi:uncharacterized protein FOMMEDRAFT_156013 [Fomitiporia mediterranea MF3/22]|uniref:uncharacterized protein n=1 Tax=Fomitiporia mediterranea (strain MF3/22) TaxID=694068 RepID=UPI0004407832|nr:uncharacterized protein FOMMEDRAFT_156013 [Fomitiporia mediterranea MF3/22]EJD02683.1 hypothetical protein FOMMEDRAFT_156013 [Fomitiporia mediterranea MF3/22]
MLLHSKTFLAFLSTFTFLIHLSKAQVTIYAEFGVPIGEQPPPCIGAVPCDGRVLEPIGPENKTILPENKTIGAENKSNKTITNENENNTVENIIPVQLYSGYMEGLSMGVPGHFFGFSLELSVVNRLPVGVNPAQIDPIFMNFMSTVISRSENLFLRVGGNTQEQSVLVPQGLEKGAMIEKGADDNSRTNTPALLISPSMIYTMANISSFLPTIRWFLGAPFNDTQSPRMEMAELGQQVLGDKLIGLQLGNEPDLYFQNGLRDPTYNTTQYDADWGEILNDYVQNPNIKNNSMFLAPSVCCGYTIGWTMEQVWETGFLDHYKDHLAYISAQHYPADNCNGSAHYDPQIFLPTIYLNHHMIQKESHGYLNSTTIAQSLGKPFLLFETNTASCGGYSGLSDSFAASLWAVDYALTFAYGNVSHALFHVGGESDYYNPFTPPTTNQTRFRQWTAGSTFYAALVVAEALGTTGTARVVDLFMNNNSEITPGFVIFEDSEPARVVLMNFLTDTSGASNYTAYVSVGGKLAGQPNATPASVQVKYLLSDSVSEKFNITWAGQTFGGPFESDGRLRGEEIIYTYACDQANNICAIPVPAPGLALVFLNSDATSESAPKTTQTFATTTTATGAPNTATVAQVILATSNGRGGGKWTGFGATSWGSASNGALGNSALLSSATTMLLGVFIVAIAILASASLG